MRFKSGSILILLHFLCFFFNCNCLCGYENFLSGSRSASLSECSVSSIDLWSVSNNQAGLAFLENPSVGIYHETKFLLKELSFNSVGAVIPVKPGTFGFNYNYFGYSKYHESKAGLSFGRKLGKKFSAGLQLDYFSTFITNSENHFPKITFELGILSFPVTNLAVGFQVLNPIPEKTENNTEITLPSIMRLGLTYTLHEKILLAVETSKDFSKNLILKAGIEYLPVKFFSLRMGIGSGPSQYSFGIGYSSKVFLLGIAFTNHPQLGITPHLDIIANFK